MLISHKHKFITVDIPKTGTRTLRETCLPLGIISFIGYNTQVFKQHSKAKDIKLHFEKIYNEVCCWDDYKKFCIIRNPWKRYLSYYTYRKRKGLNYRNTSTEDLKSWEPDVLNQGRLCSEWFSTIKNDYYGLYQTIQTMDSQDTFIYDERGELLIDYIANTETINEDIKDFLNSVGVQGGGCVVHANKSKYNKPFLEYYDQKMIDMVTVKESKIIELMNFEIPKK